MQTTELTHYEQALSKFVQGLQQTDAAHDISHIRRVVKTAKQLAIKESAEFAIVVPAAWLHDCVSFPKNHPERAMASRFAADKAIGFLTSIDYPERFFEAIHHAILAHSYSAGVTPESLEAKVIQDADRLDALGAIGVARCMQVSGALNRALYDPEDPFCLAHEPDDNQFTIDHFYNKLFRLKTSLHTVAAQQEAEKREMFMRSFLTQLADEIEAS
ncbi:HD domain-containing protein [Marinomonas agarivorans]|nr:HD domain-containing protein [Marinomonas agarivorans]